MRQLLSNEVLGVLEALARRVDPGRLMKLSPRRVLSLIGQARKANALRAGLMASSPWHERVVPISDFKCRFGCESYEREEVRRVHLPACPYRLLIPALTEVCNICQAPCEDDGQQPPLCDRHLAGIIQDQEAVARYAGHGV